MRFLIKFLLLAIIVTLSLMLFAQWRVDKEVESIVAKISPFVELKYESTSISYTGEISINSIELYSPQSSIGIEIGKLKFSIGSLVDLATFKSRLEDRVLPKKGYLIIEDFLLPFNSQVLRAAKTLEKKSSLELIQWSYCKSFEDYGLSAMDAMGYDYIAGDHELHYMFDDYSGSIIINGSSEVEEAFKSEFQLNIGNIRNWLKALDENQQSNIDLAVALPQLSLLEVRTSDIGYNLRKAQMCAVREGVSVEDYYTGHINAVSSLFNDVQLSLGESFNELYPLFIKPNSEFYWFMQPKPTFDPLALSYYSYEDFIIHGGLKVLINKKPLNIEPNSWSMEKFDQIKINYLEKQRQTQETPNQYQTVLVKQEYQQKPIGQVARFIGAKAKILRADGKLFEGKIVKVDSRRVWLQIVSSEGELELSVMPKDIRRLEVLVKVETIELNE